MSQVLFGELLGRFANLSRHDVDEILAEQAGTRHPFGEIALSWGLCEPTHVWQAWCEQLMSNVQRVDLDKLGVDAQAAAMLPGDVSGKLGVIPIRYHDGLLVVAVANADTTHVTAELARVTKLQLRFVVASAEQVQRALSTYHPATVTAAA